MKPAAPVTSRRTRGRLDACAIALLLVAVALTACGADPKEEARTLARAKGPPLLPRRRVRGAPPPTSSLMASSSTASAAARFGDTFHCTKPQVQLQHFRSRAGIRRCSRRRRPIRHHVRDGDVAGRPVAAFVSSGGLEVYAGSRVIVVFGDSAERTPGAHSLGASSEDPEAGRRPNRPAGACALAARPSRGALRRPDAWTTSVVSRSAASAALPFFITA